MAKTEPEPGLLPTRKVSRYRAQRIQAHHDASTAAPPPPLPTSPLDDTLNATQDPLARSRSRYRQKKGVNHGEQSHVKIPAIPEISNASLPKTATRQELSPRQVDGAKILRLPRKEPSIEHLSPLPSNRRVDSGTTLRSPESQTSIRHAAKQQDLTTKIHLPHSPPPTGELMPPLRPLQPTPAPAKLDGPPTSHQIRATKPTELIGEEKGKGFGFGLFRRHRDKQRSIDSTRPKTRSSESDNADDAVTPASDAPVSAVNAGERRVLLECGTYKMMYPITPTTTPVDLIKSAATTMSTPIDVKSAVLLEYFGSVGVHRAIRRYEHIRDVMNSWDHDAQNSLLLIDPGTSSSETELGLARAPTSKPRDSSWLLYYSQSVGKWDKRTVHLKRDGQITVQKDPKKPNEQTNVCHLSDFDIYTPTEEKMKKKVKPPKKHCYAVKSQQKSSMFENTTNFVHFFCVNEKSVADDFYAAVQSWRSWYLVHVLGEGKVTNVAAPVSKKAGPAPTLPILNHGGIDSVDSHYQLGSFAPLVDLDQFEKKRTSAHPDRALQANASVSCRPPRTEAVTTNRISIEGSRPASAGVSRSQTQRRQPTTELRPSSSTRSKAHQPLVDLTLQERHKHSAILDSYPEGGLVNAAINAAGDRYSSELVNRRPSSARQSIDRRQSVRRSRPSAELEPFTGQGLLAQSQDGWGDSKRGRGVLDGSHARGPMLDLAFESHFEPGTLLQQVERRQGLRSSGTDRE